MAQTVVRSKSHALCALLHPATVFVLLLLVAVRAFAGSATLAWNPVSSPALSGYMLYYGPAAGNYTSKIDVGNTTMRAVANLTDGATYHFAVTAYDSSHTESAFSNDASTTVPAGAPVAGFTASATSGVAPLAMNFTNTSTGSIASYAWTFGDGTSSTAQSPSHVYSAAGVFSVSLTVTGPGGSNTKTMPNYVTVTAATISDTSPPTAPSMLAASASGSSSINLTWQGSTDNVGVTGYKIERCQGAGCTAFAQIATLTAASFGDTGLAAGTSYSYRVRATDAAGNLSAYSNGVTATTTTVATAPVAAFSGSPTSGVAPLTVNFTSASTGTISNYAWNFGDGTTSTVQNPSHVYSTAGSYNVSLTVTGSVGSNTKTSANYVTVTAPPSTGSPALTGNLVLAAGVVDLTSTGSSDWVQWPGYVQKSTGGGKIGSLVPVGSSVSSNAYTGDARIIQWSDGTPSARGSTNAGIAMSSTGSGYQFTAPADTTTRTLTVYVGVQNATGILTAHLSDGSVPDYVQSYSAKSQRSDGVYTLTYRAASAGQTVTVKWTQSKGPKGRSSSSGNISLQSAALM